MKFINSYNPYIWFVALTDPFIDDKKRLGKAMIKVVYAVFIPSQQNLCSII